MKNYIEEFSLDCVLNEELIRGLAINRYSKGDFIIQQGETPRYLFFLIRGKIKTYKTSDDGKRLILAFKEKFDILGDIEFVQQAPYINTVEAITDVQILTIPIHTAQNYGMNHLPFVQFILQRITEKLYVNSNALAFNLMYPVEVRLCSYLLSVSIDNRTVSNQDLKDAADLIGTSKRHMNRVIVDLCNQKIIERRKDSILIVNHDRLIELAKHNIYEEGIR
ncbi:Crp/Fnr family transcriptional regulator [Ureibacillus aquaedulcis]|uniref:Cyclic nucleotide-binding domain-containing protein n=1 Tax=Ureibacillus aquaedulcis TaxID=3058421 RepID=A0ABT8GN55_9BACL|nr:cyclic nucleotide-binding domain-containing protein [Ureibacillus sp. BA0131]MDN4492842.1 cyclic nucleotide-binding domain-containing protein [Ureibacillus sp. BA0131]